MAGIDRRQFLLVVAGATGSGLAAGATAWAARARKSVDTRAATYRALVRALRAAPDGRFRHVDPDVAYGRYARWRAAQPDAVKAHADTVLDAVRRAGGPRYAEVAAPRGARRAATMTAALALACVGCEPPPAPDERPDLPTLAAT
jgi:hypothetical protein